MPLTLLPYGLPGQIFRCPMPLADYDPQGELLEEFRQHHIQAIVVLTEAWECQARTGLDLLALYAEEGWEVLHCPIRDFSVISREALHDLQSQILMRAQAGKNLAMHCFAGLGRAGLVAALLARQVLGLSGTEAVHWIRSYVPQAIQTREQLAMVLADPILPSSPPEASL